jgi:hypothetical protein
VPSQGTHNALAIWRGDLQTLVVPFTNHLQFQPTNKAEQ